MNHPLLQKASIVLTPTAYSSGKLHSIKPDYALGPELVTNGTFDTDSDWTKQTGWSISGGKANRSGASTNSFISQDIDVISGRNYIIKYDRTYVSGDGQTNLFSYFVGNSSRTTRGNYEDTTVETVTVTDYFKPEHTGNLSLRVYGISDFTGSVDNVSIKEIIDADFDFDRSSDATRVNPDGLIERVGGFGSDLVLNGNFSELGSELVTNGDYTNGLTGWSTQIPSGQTVEVINNQLHIDYDHTATQGSTGVNQTILTSGKTYKIVVDIASITGTLRVQAGGQQQDISTAGLHTFYKVPTSTILYLVRSSNTASLDVKINSVSVKQVDPNDRWTLGTDWSFEDGIVSASATSATFQQSSATLSGGTKYKLEFEITSFTSGTLNVDLGSSSYSASYTSTGVKTVILQAGGFNRPRFYGGSVTCSIDNISVKEVTGDMPRIDFTSGVGAILLEPSSTNLVTYSEDFSQSVWNKVNISVSDNTIVSPDGTQNASTITTSNTSHSLFFNFTSVASTQYTLSFYAKRGTMTDLKYRVYDLSNDGDIVAPTSYYSQTNSNSWERITLTFTTPSGCTSARVYPVSNSGVTGTMFLYGCMVEQKSYATSLIHTSGSTVTRSADAANNAGNSYLINSTEGVLYAEISALADDLSTRIISLSDGTDTNRVHLFYFSQSNDLAVNYRVGGSTVVSFIADLTDITNFSKVAFKWESGDFKMYVDGTLIDTDTNTTMMPSGTLDVLSFARGDGSFNFYGNAKTVAVFKEALTDAELTTLTS